MTNRVKYKILLTLVLYLLGLILGTMGVLPSFFHDSVLGKSHSIFNPISILLEIALYVFLTFVVVEIIFGIADQVSGKSKKHEV